MTKKVLLTQEQANRIETLKNNKKSLESILALRINGGFVTKSNECLNSLSATEIATAFLVGYEVERTPEDRIKVFYKQHDNNTGEFSKEYVEGVMLGVVVTLKHLGIKIEGVNK